jgi:hypothetical protein
MIHVTFNYLFTEEVQSSMQITAIADSSNKFGTQVLRKPPTLEKEKTMLCICETQI